MVPFKKKLVRALRLKSSVPGLPASDWIVTVGPSGLAFRRRHSAKETTVSLSWRQVIGIALIHRGEKP